MGRYTGPQGTKKSPSLYGHCLHIILYILLIYDYFIFDGGLKALVYSFQP